MTNLPLLTSKNINTNTNGSGLYATFVITIIIVVISVRSMFVVVRVPFVLLCTLSLLLSYPFFISFHCLTFCIQGSLLFAMNYVTNMFVIMIRRKTFFYAMVFMNFTFSEILKKSKFLLLLSFSRIDHKPTRRAY